MVKLPLLFLATLAICLPTLYLFNLVFGSRLSMVRAVALILVSITVTAVLTLAFAPVSLFFLVTAKSYSFCKLLNVAILLLTALVGLRFLVEGMRALNDQRSVAPVPAFGDPDGSGDGERLCRAQVRTTAVEAADGGAVATATLPRTTSTMPSAQVTASATQRGRSAHPGRAAAAERRAVILLYIWMCSGSSVPSSPGRCARSLATRARPSRSSGRSAARSMRTSSVRSATCSAGDGLLAVPRYWRISRGRSFRVVAASQSAA